MSLTVGTYNVCKPDDQKVGSWDLRKDKLISNLAKSNLDVVCLQELNTSLPMRQWWTAELSKIGYNFHYHACKETSGVGVIYKTDKFLLAQETKEVFRSGEQKRAVVQLDLVNVATQKTVRVASMHLYGGPDKTLANSQVEHFRKIAESKDSDISQIILAGDFNSESYDQPCKKLARKTDYVYKTVERDLEGNVIITNTARKARKIDWIYVGHKNPTDQQNLEPITFQNLHENASDHRLHALRVTTDPVSGDYSPVNTSIPFPEELKDRLDLYQHITRRDVLKHYGDIDKDEASHLLSIWIADGILVQEGSGKGTIYKSVKQDNVETPHIVKERNFLDCILDCLKMFIMAFQGAPHSHHRLHRHRRH